MADRIRKRKNRDGSSTQRRRRLAEFSSSSGFLMPKCSYCHEHGLDCHVSGTSNRCGPCNRVNRPSCDVWGLDPGTCRVLLGRSLAVG
ncbi:hypothetical protein N657DRAFT_640395 [Parathielavia appendiculata]|uniref:Uncharacterized protein n=1 Tax=Parathielavia appendiculata TaxID=2587402 RepID=A0AAN6Z9M3_9PEZI|nr:hypothetical protein N657DRAFT_640395 [Parathielavia appendiculata]